MSILENKIQQKKVTKETKTSISYSKNNNFIPLFMFSLEL